MELHSVQNEDSPISYNLAMTSTAMAICPRRSEGLMVCRDDGTDLDYVALNGTILGGTLMVKNEELWHLLRHDKQRMESVLQAIGVPPEFATSHSHGTSL